MKNSIEQYFPLYMSYVWYFPRIKLTLTDFSVTLHCVFYPLLLFSTFIRLWKWIDYCCHKESPSANFMEWVSGAVQRICDAEVFLCFLCITYDLTVLFVELLQNGAESSCLCLKRGARNREIIFLSLCFIVHTGTGCIIILAQQIRTGRTKHKRHRLRFL